MTALWWFALATPIAAGCAAFMHNTRQYERADRERELIRSRSSGALALMTEHKRRTLGELQREVEYNVTSHDQQGGLTAGRVDDWDELAVVPRRRMVKRPRFGQPTRSEPFYDPLPPISDDFAAPADGPWPEPEPGHQQRLRAELETAIAPSPWPDRHPTLYRHLPWPVRRFIISHYLKESDA